MPWWRNWQTRYVQVVVRAISWEFKSPPRHKFDGAGKLSVTPKNTNQIYYIWKIKKNLW